MNFSVKKLLICLSLLTSINAFADTIPIFISGKILDTNGNPVQGVRMIAPESALDGSSSQPVKKSLLFSDIPDECISYASDSVITNAEGVFIFKAEFSPKALVVSMMPNRCLNLKNSITRSSLRLVPHPDDVKRFKLEIASEALPFRYNSE